MLRYNPYNVTHGVDWSRHFSIPQLDFCCIHMYADQWCGGKSHEVGGHGDVVGTKAIPVSANEISDHLLCNSFVVLSLRLCH